MIRRAAGARWSRRPGRPAGGTAVLLACAALLAGCSSTAATQAASSTPATPAAGSGANPSGTAANAGGARQTSAQQSASGPATGGGCTNLTATAAVKAQVTATYRAMDPAL